MSQFELKNNLQVETMAGTRKILTIYLIADNNNRQSQGRGMNSLLPSIALQAELFLLPQSYLRIFELSRDQTRCPNERASHGGRAHDVD